jgi:hypothetical protein
MAARQCRPVLLCAGCVGRINNFANSRLRELTLSDVAKHTIPSYIWFWRASIFTIYQNGTENSTKLTKYLILWRILYQRWNRLFVIQDKRLVIVATLVINNQYVSYNIIQQHKTQTQFCYGKTYGYFIFDHFSQVHVISDLAREEDFPNVILCLFYLPWIRIMSSNFLFHKYFLYIFYNEVHVDFFSFHCMTFYIFQSGFLTKPVDGNSFY